ncbi:hypothetical protein FDP41_009380 [Naegleria fowleri]|uniref:Aminotransferase class I/classII large domain-containing protein n=1 Tax=Naegleria fowleri TaxID=5763 RepID=A0A6A5B2R5_NAEFO|nr:uncharacterized protein FDP41_009380 [Naegleria fowleri]KAF0972477.1 hypothetical protein FDP41_009380 [Naegleria fowleri]CAG4710558.1 unnamed protein product [Naegleria fowleri]
MSSPPLSKRSEHFSVSPAFVQAMGKVFSNVFHKENNPNGIINLAVAENVLVSEWLCKTFHEIAIQHPLEPSNLNYTNFCGANEFRIELVNRLFKKYIFKRGIHSEKQDDPFEKEFFNINNYFVCNGAGDVLEMLGASLCDPGEYIMIPAPLYLGFQNDFNKRFHGHVLPIQMPYNPETKSFELTVEMVREVFEKESKTKNIRAFLLCNPNNPTGDMFNENIIRDLIDFCKEKSIHFISDELYALSVFGEGEPFVSATNVMREDDKNYVHIVYSFSKDLCLNGFRMGILFTMNEQLKKVFDTCSYFTGVSSHSQHLMTHFLRSQDKLSQFLELNRKTLGEQYAFVSNFLRERNIEYVETRAGLFIWFNVERLMKQYVFRKGLMKTPSLQDALTQEEEYQVWLDVIDHALVNISPAQFYMTNLTGWVRVCFSAQKIDILTLALERFFNLMNN